MEHRVLDNQVKVWLYLPGPKDPFFPESFQFIPCSESVTSNPETAVLMGRKTMSSILGHFKDCWGGVGDTNNSAVGISDDHLNQL